MGFLTRFLSLTILFSTLFILGCNKKGKKPFFFLPPSSTTSSQGNDSNGTPLPPSSGNSQASQEVATSGPASINGKFEAFDNNSPDSLFNFTANPIQVSLVDPDGNVIATTFLDNTGAYYFCSVALPPQCPQANLPSSLQNNNYRVLINTGYGLNFAYSDFNYTYNPTSANGYTLVEIANIRSDVLHYTSGAASIGGKVTTPGFKNQAGAVVVPAGGMNGATVQLLDTNGNILLSTQTDGAGNFLFSLQNLSNGNYTVRVLGSALSGPGMQPFTDVDSSFRFTFLGNNQTVATPISLNLSSAWVPASSATGSMANWAISNAALSGADLNGFTVILKDSSGNTIATTTSDSAGKFSFSQSMSSGVYSIEVSKTGYYTGSSSFSFTADPSGLPTSVTQSGAINIVPKPANITGQVKSGSLQYVPGSTINFRPDSTQSPAKLIYLLNDDRLRDLVRVWIREGCSNNAVDFTTTATIVATCTNLAGPNWNYATYANKLYEVRPDYSVFFTAVAGKWAYYVSAPGYQNFGSPNAPLSITISGADQSFSAIEMVSSSKRSQIAGTVAVLDTLSDNSNFIYQGAFPGFTNRNTSLPGLFVVLLGNTTVSGNPVAHITLTDASGNYSFNGSSKVVTIPANLTTDEQRLGYAVLNFATAPTLGASGLAVLDDPTASVDLRNGTEFNFRQSSYVAFIIDKLGHLNSFSTGLDNNAIATNTYITSPVTLNSTLRVLHKPRRLVTGTVSDAISTAVISGATVEIGINTSTDPGITTFGTARRDCSNTDTLDGNSCTIQNASRLAQSDSAIGSVTTNSSGVFTIKNIDPGNYVVKVTQSGYESILIPITVPPTGATTEVNPQVVQSGNPGNITGRVILAGGTPFTGTYTLEVIHPTSGVRPIQGVQPASLTSGTTTFSNASQYTIFGLTPGQWKVRFASAGYNSVEGILNVQSNFTTSFDIITFIPGTQAPSSISGKLINALNNQAITSGLLVKLRPGVNVSNGNYASDMNGITISGVNSSSDGSYVIPNVPSGNYTLEVQGGQFYETTYKTVISAGANSANQNVLVSPNLPGNQIRVVLSWNARPRDLDSHLEYNLGTVLDGGYKSQVVWNQKSKLSGDLLLDYDITTGYGPETVTIGGVNNSIWSKPRRGYSIYNWSNEYINGVYQSIGSSGATIKIYKSTGLVKTYNAPGNMINRWWQIFCISSTMAIIDAGQAGCSTNDFFNAPAN